jgi:hypothetical protein
MEGRCNHVMTDDPGARRRVLEEVRSLVAADGADLEPWPDYEEGPLIELRLIIPVDGCEECVLPRPVLEELAGHLFQQADPTVEAVRVHDPRQPPVEGGP